MLKKAWINLKGFSIYLKKEDFKTLSKSWEERFDMIICMTTSFPHNKTRKEAIQTLKSMCDRLNYGGIIVIDNGISDSFLKAKPKFIPARIHEDQAFYFFLEYPNPEKVIFNILNVKKTSKGFNHAFESMEYMALGKKDFENLFSNTNFDRVEFFGDYDFSLYSETDSKRIIIIAQQ